MAVSILRKMAQYDSKQREEGTPSTQGSHEGLSEEVTLS